MKYPGWDKVSDETRGTAIKIELELATHNGTTKDDLLKMLRWLWRREIVRAYNFDGLSVDALIDKYGKEEVMTALSLMCGQA